MDISTLAGVTEVTIRNRCKDILSNFKLKGYSQAGPGNPSFSKLTYPWIHVLIIDGRPHFDHWLTIFAVIKTPSIIMKKKTLFILF